MKKTVLFAVLMALLLGMLAACSSSPEADYTSYDWGSILGKDADWYASDEGRAIANKILLYQLPDGGWRKSMGDTAQTGSWAKSTVDNSTTTSQIRVLAKAYKYTGNSKYKNGCIKGIKLLLSSQYGNGGWPQVFGDEGTYHAHITYNDNAMVNVLSLLTEVRDKSGDFEFVSNSLSEKAGIAVEKGIQCILDTQITVNSEYTGWCQQHDEFTLKPTAGRSYELASIASSESVKIVNYLMSIDNPSEEITKRIAAAVRWMEKSAIYGIRVENFINEQGEEDRRVVEDSEAGPLWARFYSLDDGTSPIFVSRKGIAMGNWNHIGSERRSGYAWYGNWCRKLVDSEK